MLLGCHLCLWTLDLFFNLILKVRKLVLLLVIRDCALARCVLLCSSHSNVGIPWRVHCFVVNFFRSFFWVLSLVELKLSCVPWSSLTSDLDQDLFEKLWKRRVILLVLDHDCIRFARQLFHLITDLSIWILKQHGLECTQRLWLFCEQRLSLWQVTGAVNAD